MSTYPVGTPSPVSRTNSSQPTVVFPTPDAPYSYSTGSAITAASIGAGHRPVERYPAPDTYRRRPSAPGAAGHP